jgi:hypothetical protein
VSTSFGSLREYADLLEDVLWLILISRSLECLGADALA